LAAQALAQGSVRMVKSGKAAVYLAGGAEKAAFFSLKKSDYLMYAKLSRLSTDFFTLDRLAAKLYVMLLKKRFPSERSRN